MKDCAQNLLHQAASGLPINSSLHRAAFVILSGLIGLALPFFASAQVLYGTATHPSTSCGRVFKIDVANCTVCPVSGCGQATPSDFAILPDGTRLVVGGYYINRLTALPNTQVIWVSQPYYGVLNSVVQVPGGPTYLASETGVLYLYDPGTNNITLLGTLPGYMNELIFSNGVLYALVIMSGQTVLLQVNTANPSQSTILYSNVPGTYATEGGVWNGNSGYYYTSYNSSDNQLFFFNTQTGLSEQVCDMNAFLTWPNTAAFGSLTTMPPDLPELDCLTPCIFSYAGVIPPSGPVSVCTNQTLDYPATQGQIVGSGSLLQYILFGNPADTVGSIVAMSATPSFAFNPATMQTGVTYYMAAAVGAVNAAGLIDFNDPCLHISNALQMTWRPLPALNFSVAGGTDLCAGDCRTLQIDFTGTAPFLLGYTTPTGTFLQYFSSNPGFIQVCIPANSAPGTFPILTTTLTDAFCICN